jgi:hypothetical protein
MFDPMRLLLLPRPGKALTLDGEKGHADRQEPYVKPRRTVRTPDTGARRSKQSLPCVNRRWGSFLAACHGLPVPMAGLPQKNRACPNSLPETGSAALTSISGRRSQIVGYNAL